MDLNDSMREVEKSRNPPKFESGFEDDEGGLSVGDDIEFDFGDDSGFDSSIFGDEGDDNGLFSSDSFGQLEGIPSNNGNMYGQQPVPQKASDKMMDATMESAVEACKLIPVMVKSFKNRNADDWSIYGKNIFKTGTGMMGTGIAIICIAFFANIKMLLRSGLSMSMGLCGLLLVGTSMMIISGAVFKMLKIDDSASSVDVNSLDNLESDYDKDIYSDFGDIYADEEEDEDYDSIMSVLDDEYAPNDEDEDGPNLAAELSKSSEDDDDIFNRIAQINEKDKNNLDTIPEHVPFLDRSFLVERFKQWLMINSPDFSKSTAYDSEDEKFKEIETLAISALASAAGKEIGDLGSKSYITELSETMFCYVLKLKRINSIKVRTEKLQEEVEAYFSEESDDEQNPDAGKVSAVVDIQKDNYIIKITKSKNKVIVTLGDCFQKQTVVDFFKNAKNKLPIIAGITDTGVPILEDAKIYDVTLIAGKQRSGKSWYITSLLIQLAMFNLPEDVQFIIIDPKESYLFKCMSYLPHCCGIFNHENTLDILDDVIKKEGARRKKLLSDNQCDTVWSLRDKGIKIPILYIVIDEYMTVNDYYKERSSELKSKINVLMSQLPSQGIRIMFVPHRAQGVVDKTSRSLLSYTAAVKCDNSIVQETLDIKKWDRRLTMPGDIAIRLADKTMYVRGAALTLDDNDNAKFIKDLAKAFYKMGVEIPDMSTVGYGCNRNEADVKEALEMDSEGNKVQYDAEHIMADLNKI